MNEKIRLMLIASADEVHKQHAHYANYFDGWLLGVTTRKVDRIKTGTICLVKIEPSMMGLRLSILCPDSNMVIATDKLDSVVYPKH